MRQIRTILGILVLTGGLLIGIAEERHAEAHHDSEICQPDGPDSDNDGLSTSCDPAPAFFDFDVDGASDSLEVFLGSNALDGCPTPTDLNGNGITNVVDVGFFIPAMNSTIAQEPYRRFLDFTASEVINTLDTGKFVPVLNKPGCPGNPSLNAVPQLFSYNEHFHPAPRFTTSAIFVLSVDDEPLFDDPFFCELFRKNGALWSDEQIRIVLQILSAGPECESIILPSIEFSFAPLEDPALGSYRPYGAGGQDCFNDPCDEATFGSVVIEDDPLLLLDEAQLDRVIQHELGHAVGNGHPSGGDCQNWSIMTAVAGCSPNVRLQDILFTRIKY